MSEQGIDWQVIETVLFVVGLVHVAVYALACAVVTICFLLDWAVRKAGLTKDIVHAYFIYCKSRNEALKRPGR